jgi:hypothetical protein
MLLVAVSFGLRVSELIGCNGVTWTERGIERTNGNRLKNWGGRWESNSHPNVKTMTCKGTDDKKVYARRW